MSLINLTNLMALSCLVFFQTSPSFAQSQNESVKENRATVINQEMINKLLIPATTTSALKIKSAELQQKHELGNTDSKNILIEKAKKSLRGGSSDGGGFVSENSSILLNKVSKGLSDILKRSSPRVLKNLAISVTKDQLIRIVENIRSRPLAREWRDGKELMFNFGHDQAGSYIEVLEPFFAVYGSTPVKFLSADKLKDIVLDLQLKMLHEAAHLWNLNEDDSEKFGMDILKAIEGDLIYCGDVTSEWVIHRGKSKVWAGWVYGGASTPVLIHNLFKDFSSIKSKGIEIGELESRIKVGTPGDAVFQGSVSILSASKLEAFSKMAGDKTKLELELVDHVDGTTSYKAKNFAGDTLICEDVY